MLIVFPLRTSNMVGTDILHAAALLWVAGIGHYVAGNVDLRTVMWLLMGSISGVLLSSGLTLKLPDSTLRAALAVTLIGCGIKLVEIPYGDEIAVGRSPSGCSGSAPRGSSG